MVVDNHNYVEAAARSFSNIMVSPMDLTVMIAQGEGRMLAFLKPAIPLARLLTMSHLLSIAVLLSTKASSMQLKTEEQLYVT